MSKSLGIGKGNYERKPSLGFLINDMKWSHGKPSHCDYYQQKLYSLWINTFRNNYNNDGTLKSNRYPVKSEWSVLSTFIQDIKQLHGYDEWVVGERRYFCPDPCTGIYDEASYFGTHKPHKDLKFKIVTEELTGTF